MTDAKTPDPKADPKAETQAEEGTEEETFEEQQARAGGFPPPHSPDEAPNAPYKDLLEEQPDQEHTPAGQAVAEGTANKEAKPAK